MSIALARQIVIVGRVVNRWEELYPLLRWRVETDYRRHLSLHERHRFRQAMYRVWLYAKAFHGPEFLAKERSIPRATSRDPRLSFIRQFNNHDIIEIAELYDVLHEMVNNDICPSNAMIQKRYAQGFPGKDVLYFGSYETYPLSSGSHEAMRRKVPSLQLPRDMVRDAWGCYTSQYTQVEDVMKLKPDQLLHLRDDLHCKADRVEYIDSMPDIFHHSPATIRSALEVVMAERDFELGSDHGVDGGILDYFDETPGGRYEDIDRVEDVGRL